MLPRRQINTRRFAKLLLAVAGVVIASCTPIPRPHPPADLVFTVDGNRQWPISRFIYGANFITDTRAWGGASPPRGLTLNRIGGNRLSAYNWENNFSNAGRDRRFQNDSYLSMSTKPGEAVRERTSASLERGAGVLVTVPMLGFVAGDNPGTPLDTSDANRSERLVKHFKMNLPTKDARLSLSPDTRDEFVYQDEFVNWLMTTFPQTRKNAKTPIMFSLDNEPDLWYSTHKEVDSDVGDDRNEPRIQSYSQFAERSIAFARAIKSVYPEAVVFGPATATYVGMASLGRYAGGMWHDDPVFGRQNALEVYLDQMRGAEYRDGKRLLDVLDVHWYPETGTRSYRITNDYAAQSDTAELSAIRIQAPRDLWDAEYTDPNSWVVSANGGPIKLLRRLKQQIAEHYPGTKIAISEYYYGRGGDLSGGIAQADLLGIFGREGVYAAALWPNASVFAAPYNGDGARAYAYVFGAFRMYLDYDGHGGRFGDTGVAATTSDSVSSSVYASIDAAGRVVLVAINKSPRARTAEVRIRFKSRLTSGVAYTLTSAQASPLRAATCARKGSSTCTIGDDNVVSYAMPAMSVNTIVLK